MTLDTIIPNLCCPCRGVPTNLVLRGAVECDDCKKSRGRPGKLRGPVTIECLDPSRPEWERWRTYRNEATAEQAMRNLQRKYVSWQFRSAGNE